MAFVMPPFGVRKHRAPKGALRLQHHAALRRDEFRQKAPSAKRCIKTCDERLFDVAGNLVRKHRAPKGALRRLSRLVDGVDLVLSESTERQKVH